MASTNDKTNTRSVAVANSSQLAVAVPVGDESDGTVNVQAVFEGMRSASSLLDPVWRPVRLL